MIQAPMEPLKVCLTADVHIGMSFSRYADSPSVQNALVAARVDTLSRLVDRANAAQCDLFVVAGDLFEHHRVARDSVSSAVGALSGFAGAACLVLPGNHDYIASDSRLWKAVAEDAPDSLLVLSEATRYELDSYGLAVDVLAAPCDQKHSSSNRVEWMSELKRGPADRWCLGVAHGALEGVSPDRDGRYFPMSVSRLEQLEPDLWLLGHTHITVPERPSPGDTVFNAGTPEPDGFDCSHGGRALIIELGGSRENPNRKTEILETGQLRFVRRRVELRDASDVDDLEVHLRAAPLEQTLTRLELFGRLSDSERRTMRERLDSLREEAFYLVSDESELRTAITREIVDGEFPAASVPHLLLTRLLSDGDEEAAELAFDIINEVRRDH